MFSIVAPVLGFGHLAEEVLKGDTTAFDLAVLTTLYIDGILANPLGLSWVEEMGRHVASLWSYVFLGFVLVPTVNYASGPEAASPGTGGGLLSWSALEQCS